jgi:hypothetical protein
MFPPFPPPASYTKEVYTRWEYFDYHQLISRWALVFGESTIQPRIFEPERLVSGDIVDDFMSAASLTHLRLARPEAHNTNVTPEAQRFVIGLYSALQKEGLPATEVVRQVIRNVLQARFPGSGVAPPRCDVERFVEVFQASNEEVRARWFKCLPTLFGTDFTRYPNAPTDEELSDGEIYSIVAQIVTDYPEFLDYIRR